MKNKTQTNEPLFTNQEIELLKDVTKSHQVLAQHFGKSIAIIQEYRRNNLGIFLRGLNYDLQEIRDTINWELNDVFIARVMKVSPETVVRWRLKLFGKTNKRNRLSDEQQRNIASSSEKSSKLAVEHGVTVWTINRVRRNAKTTDRIGRPKLTFKDFPLNTNWRLPTNQLARELGISWITADRLRTEALIQADYEPTVQIQLELPITIEDRPLPPSLDAVDWKESTSLLSTYLKLDKSEVSRFKSISRNQRRKRKAL